MKIPKLSCKICQRNISNQRFKIKLGIIDNFKPLNLGQVLFKKKFSY